MKNLVRFIGLALVMVVGSKSALLGQAADMFQTYIVLDVGAGNIFRAGGVNADAGTAFNNLNFGNKSPEGTMKLAGAEIKTYKNNGGDVTGAKLNYRLYKTGDTPGSFTEINIPWSADLGGGDQRWQTLSSNINLLSNAESSGEYTLEVYWRITTNLGDRFDNNSSNNYKATFTVIYQTSIATSAGWRMLSSPVNTTFSDILAEGWTQGASAGGDVTNGTPNVRTYNGTSFVNVTDLTTSPSVGQGFIYYHFNDDNFDSTPNGAATVFSVSGSENAAPVSPTLNSTNKAGGVDNTNGWSLIGNPFASTIDWDLLTKSNVEGSVYTYSSGSFISWNGTTGSITNGLLAPFQGFFVQTSETGSPTITMESADKTSGGTFYGKVAEVSSVELSVSCEGLRNGAFLQFSEGANIGYDSKDAWKLLPLDLSYALLGTRLDAEHVLDINNLPLFTERFELPMSFQATKSGRFTLSAPKVNLPADWSITLVDNVTGDRVALTADLSYSFETNVASKAATSVPTRPVGVKAAGVTRFTLIIEPNKTTSVEGRFTPNAIALEQNYPNPFNPTTAVSFTLASQSDIKLSVFDINGREVDVVASGVKSAGKHTVNWNAAGRASGVYMLRLQVAGQVLTRKMTLLK